MDLSDSELASVGAIPQLQFLNLTASTVTDSGLKGLLQSQKLETLLIVDTPITDEGLKLLVSLKSLTSLKLASTKVTSVGVAALQKALPNCKIEWPANGKFYGQPAKLAYLDPSFQQWVKATQALPAEQQIEAVSKKLMELNPGFDGRMVGIGSKGNPYGPIFKGDGVVKSLGLNTKDVTDISPVRAFVGLKGLSRRIPLSRPTCRLCRACPD